MNHMDHADTFGGVYSLGLLVHCWISHVFRQSLLGDIWFSFYLAND